MKMISKSSGRGKVKKFLQMERFKPVHAVLFAGFLLAGAPVYAAETGIEPNEALEAYVYLHRNPEVGKDLPIAHDYIVGRLQALGGFSFENVPSLPSAVIAILDSGRPGPVIALRADMDARRLDVGDEPTSHDPQSQLPGLMHNCGHDAHSAMLLGAAAELHAHPEEFKGKIVFLFQPAEEVKGGADDIVADGILTRLGVRAIFAQHVVAGQAVGEVTVSQGSAMAGSNTFKLTLSGTASHAAMPYEGADLGVTSAKIILELANLPARGWDSSNRPAVISVTKISSSSNSINATPAEITIEGTLRAFEPLGDVAISGSFNNLIAVRIGALAQVYGASIDWHVTPGTPPTINDVSIIRSLATDLGTEAGVKLAVSTDRFMTSEDFAYYGQQLPAVYFGQGIAKDGLGDVGVHQREFTIHPDALPNGVRFLVALARLASERLH
ncbi:M20 family metallopeptidase [Rhizobium rhizogenes]|uniref:M20 family metallopeptidase n=1 Tax=Rhizobium rhizogenes TaxID=359 RepID=UPI001573CA2D|nr:M20 family metallopeptidase [Rhizobium rhizogenes]NTH68666.1 amidohydrolase [Rhizobium rhizogenes]NTI39643.1 amidohydrolase [Rhizobium rhizogenes]WEO69865.1 M20 family metallopeptidase [Rhizobium rhizogenes]